ncbi:MAG: hypothetical protein WBY53_09265 [Acidobacteriaceae bacterium]
MHHLSSKFGLSLSLSLLCTLATTLHAQQAPTNSSVAPPSVQLADAVSSSSSSASDPAASPDQPASPATIDAPVPQQSQSNEPAPKQTNRILGILPNFRAVSADVHLPPQTVKQKFITASEDSFDYSAIFVPLAIAGYDLESNPDPEFGTGGVAYGRYLWHAAVDQTSENFFVEAIVPSITREDNRYYTLGHGGFLKRTGYALTRVVITRSDSGKEVFNASEVLGSGASAGLSNLYYPTRERSLGNTGSQWGLDVGIDALSFVVKEFWPDINHALFHGAPPSQQISHSVDNQ